MDHEVPEANWQKAAWQEAVLLFNQQAFFECHEVLEALWLQLSPGEERQLAQGVLQIAVGFYHWQRGNWVGAKNKLESGLLKVKAVEKLPEYWEGSNQQEFVESVRVLLANLLDEGPAAASVYPSEVIPTLLVD